MIYNAAANEIQYEDGRTCLVVACPHVTADKLFAIADAMPRDLVANRTSSDKDRIAELESEAEETDRRIANLEKAIHRAQNELDAAVA